MVGWIAEWVEAVIYGIRHARENTRKARLNRMIEALTAIEPMLPRREPLRSEPVPGGGFTFSNAYELEPHDIARMMLYPTTTNEMRDYFLQKYEDDLWELVKEYREKVGSC